MAITGLDLVQKWIGREGAHEHRQAGECPMCYQDVTTIGITGLVYTFETCDCGTPEYDHLVEQLWHRECFRNASA